MTDREKAIAMAYTGICFLQGDKLGIFYEYVRELFGRPVFTHEFLVLRDELKEKSKSDFMKLCEEETEPVTDLHDKHWDECRQIALYSDELDKYKRLLNLAISDIRGCDKCAHGEQVDKWHRVYTCKCKKFDGAGGYVGAACDHFRWVHADEVEEYLSARPD